MTDLEHSFEGSDGQVLVVRLPGEIDHSTAETITGEFSRLLPDRTDAAAVLDFSEVDLVSSIGITALLQVRERCLDAGVPLALAGVPAKLTEFFAMLRLDSKFQFEPDVAGAMAWALARAGA